MTNNSNKAVTAYLGFTKDIEVTEDITGNFDITTKQLNTGTVGGYATADKVTSTLTIGGALDSAKTSLTKVGTITVTIQQSKSKWQITICPLAKGQNQAV